MRKHSLIKLMVSYDLPRSMVTDQITFDQQDLNSVPDLECVMDRGYQMLVSNLESVDSITFTLLKKGKRNSFQVLRSAATSGRQK